MAAGLPTLLLASLAAVRVASECPAAGFACNGSATGPMLAPSWCNSTNPFIVAQPPVRLSNYSTENLATYEPLYRCDDTANPFSSCQLIQSFFAMEVPAFGNTTQKLVVVTTRDSSAANPNSSLAIYDDTFTRVDEPITGYMGTLDQLSAIPYRRAGTTLVLYGGASAANWSSLPVWPPSPCTASCVALNFLEIDNRGPSGVANHTAAYNSLGAYFEGRATCVDQFLFVSPLDATSVAALNRKASAWSAGRVPRAAANARRSYGTEKIVVNRDFYLLDEYSDEYPDVASSDVAVLPFSDGTDYVFAAALVSNEESGWSIVIFMYFDDFSPFCAFYYNQRSCFLPVARWSIAINGVRTRPEDSLKLRTTTAYYNCSVLATEAVAASYGPYYNESNCGGRNVLFLVGTQTTISTFSFSRSASSVNASIVIDLAASAASRTFNATLLSAPGADTISDFVAFSEVALAHLPPPPSDENATAAVHVQPSSVWLAVVTFNAAFLNGSASEASSSTLLIRLPQFSDPLGGVGPSVEFPPALPPSTLNPAGSSPDGQSCSWNEFWNGTACAAQPYVTITHADRALPKSLAVQWRSLPVAVIAVLAEAGCTLWDTPCLTQWINATFFGNASFMAAPSWWRAGGPPRPARGGSAALRDTAAWTYSERAQLRELLSALSASADAPGSTPAQLLALLMTAAYGNRFLLFAPLTSTQLAVVDAMPMGCLPGSGVGLSWSLQNLLTLVGSMQSIHVTANAQYVFGSVERPQYALAAMERIVEICAQLQLAPADPFLQGYAAACSDASALPRLPAVADFLAVASACLLNSGMWCPSFNNEELQPLPSGTYSTFGFDAVPCEPGYLCKDGQRQLCPVGFTCAATGTVLPQICGKDDTLSHTCFGGGLAVPALCPNGTLCGAPFLPALPAPPGFAQSVEGPGGRDGSSVRTLVPCDPGEWCGLGRSVMERPALDCPAGTFCEVPGVLEPAVCNLGGNCSSQGCPVIPYCPPGSTSEQLCPAGSYCSNTTAETACSAGSYCPAGSPLWALCQAASYCPNPAEEEVCPDNAYCPEGSIDPTPCNPLSLCYCAGGCAEPPASVVLAVAAIFIGVVAGMYAVWRLWGRSAWALLRNRWKRARLERSRLKLGGSGHSINGLTSAGIGRAREALGTSLLEFADTSTQEGIVGTDGRIASLERENSLMLGALLVDASATSVQFSSSVHPASGSQPGYDGRHVVVSEEGKEAGEGEYSVVCNDDDGGTGGESAAGASVGASRTGIASTARRARAPALSLLFSRRQSSPVSALIVRKMFPVHVRFENLGLRLKNGGAMVLDGVTGELRPGRVCAVMGPSGAGKTTCLTSLCGKASYGNLSGDITINGTPGLLTDPQFKHLVGFVPQDDIMMRDLTVEENITWSALTRLPASWSVDRKVAFADYVIDLLGLGDLRDSLIGDETRRGISGGQRKRVNIGLELAADPQVLILDEPTSGLDAAGCTAVCSALRRIADMSVTVALVLHQPRWEIFNSFDDLLLLGKGGRTVYYGPTSEALPYIESSLQVVCPGRVNPADFLLDVVGGDVPPQWRAAHPEWTPSDLFGMWARHSHAAGAKVPPQPSPAATPDTDGQRQSVRARGSFGGFAVAGAYEDPALVAASHPGGGRPPPHDPLDFTSLVWLFLSRAITQQLRHPLIFALNNGLVASSALFLAAVYYGSPSYLAPQPIEAFMGCPAQVATGCQVCLSAAGDSVLNRGVMTIISLGLTGVATFLPVFGAERVVYWREACSLPQPLHTLAYYVGKDLAMLPQLLLGPLVFTVAYLALTTPRASFWEYYWVFLGVYWCASAFGYLTSVLSPPSLSQLLGVVTIFSNAMFAGGQPTLRDMRAKFIPLRWLPAVSFMRYALEALYTVEVRNYEAVVALQGLSLAEMVSDNFGYELLAYSQDVATVFLIGLVLRVAALAFMLVLHREKKL